MQAGALTTETAARAKDTCCQHSELDGWQEPFEHCLQGAVSQMRGPELCLSLTERGLGLGPLPPGPGSHLLCALCIVQLGALLREILPVVLFLFSPKQMLIQGQVWMFYKGGDFETWA